MHTKTHIETADVIALDAQAVRASIQQAGRVTPGDLNKPTPCAGWTVYGLLAHMATQHYGFAAASRGEEELELWKLRSLGSDPVRAYVESAEHVLAAFAAEGVLDRTFPLPEFSAEQPFPARQAICFHIVDYVVHSWDLAKSLGTSVEFEPELVEVAHEVVRHAPTGDARLVPGAPFGSDVPWSGGSRLDELVAFLGRSPGWPV